MRDYLDRVCNGTHLTADQTAEIFGALISGELDPVEIAALLIALRAKGEQPDEIAGAATALRDSADPFPRPEFRFADSCGTGGDGARTINISTTVALVAAELEIPVAKHGNRSVSSDCGSADVLEQLGVKIDSTAQVSRRCLDEIGICFLFAPQYHSGLRFAMPVRRALGVRTMMNLLGPLVNPSAPAVQIVGVYDARLCVPIARTLGLLGCDDALVVHGSGLDEIALHGPTTGARLHDGDVEQIEIAPRDAGLDQVPIERLRGGDPGDNAKRVRELLEGRGDGAHEAAVAINAGALAWIFGRADDLRQGTELALEAIRRGGAGARLEAFARLSHGA